MTPSRLQPGVFLGETLRSCAFAGLRLTESRYAPGLALPAHAHDHAFFCLVLDGSYTEKVNGRTRTCTHSSLLYHPPHEVHSDTFHGAGGRCLSIELDNQWLQRARQQSAIFNSPTEFQDKQLASLTVRLCRELKIMDGASPLAIEGLMLEVLAEVARQRIETRRTTPRWMKAVRELLHDRFTERLSLAVIAQSVGVHPMHLARAFRRHYDCSVGEYIRKLRIEFARMELIRTRSPLSAIALASGFFDQSHFTRVFRHFTGSTPATYRAAFRTR
jgi:AraC family transcriptional regulator